MTAMEVLELAGLPRLPVAEQMTPDGQFPNVTKTPEPRSARIDGPGRCRWPRSDKADLVLATDPDADRLGGA